jgi:hypothetical protein
MTDPDPRAALAVAVAGALGAARRGGIVGVEVRRVVPPAGPPPRPMPPPARPPARGGHVASVEAEVEAYVARLRVAWAAAPRAARAAFLAGLVD